MAKSKMNLPNKLSMFRILMVPVFMIFFAVPLPLSETVTRIIIAVIFEITYLTDMIDGKIARKFNQVSNLGKLLDPVADKFTIFALAIVLFLKFKEAQSESMQAFAWVFLLFIAKDIIMILGSIVLIALGTRPVAAEIWGKLATFAFYAVMVVIIGFGPEIGAISSYYPQYAIPETVMFILVVVAVILTFVAFFSYLPSAIKQIKENSKKNK